MDDDLRQRRRPLLVMLTTLRYDLLRRVPNPSREEIRRELAGNICRCTGYHAIVDAVEDAAARLRGAPAGRRTRRRRSPNRPRSTTPAAGAIRSIRSSRRIRRCSSV